MGINMAIVLPKVLNFGAPWSHTFANTPIPPLDYLDQNRTKHAFVWTLPL